VADIHSRLRMDISLSVTRETALRLGSPSMRRTIRAALCGMLPDWVKMKNPEAQAVKGLVTSYLSTTNTVTLTSDIPAILTIVPETCTVNSS
jgi:hypothetical protein